MWFVVEMEPIILRESLFCLCVCVRVWSDGRFHLLSFPVCPLYSDSAC